jgi:hypothetical protein
MSVQMTDIHSCSYHCDRPECIKAQRDELRERLAQPEQDVPATRFGNMGPVGWFESPDGAFRANPLYKIQFPSSLLSWQVPLYMALPQPEQEPVAWLYRDSWGTINLSQIMPPPVGAFPVYTSQSQRKPLTDNELADLWYKQSLDWMEFARAIEAAHGIKES